METGVTEDMVDQEPETVANHLSSWRSANAGAKADAALDYVRTLIDAGEQVVVFSAHKSGVIPFNEIGGVITGETGLPHRKAMADAFQNKELKCLAGTIGAMGVGLTLTAACHVVFIDRDWTPAMNKQAEDRVCRIGQTRGTVVVDIVSDNNTDQVVTKVLQRKIRLLESTFGI
jgi:hypothetical protein